MVRFQRAASDEEFAQYLDEYGRVLEAEARFGTVFVTAPNLPMPPGRHVRMQAHFLKTHTELVAERLVGAAFSLPSPLMRGVVRAILMLQPMLCPQTVVETEAEGVAWVKARLWTDHVRRMKSATT